MNRRTDSDWSERLVGRIVGAGRPGDELARVAQELRRTPERLLAPQPGGRSAQRRARARARAAGLRLSSGHLW